MKCLYLICGPSGSGKTTRAFELMSKLNITHHFEADMWMNDRFGNYCFDSKRLRDCHKKCQQKTEEAMKLGKSIIVSNTTLIKREAVPYISLAKKYNYQVVIEHMTGQFTNLHGVPDWKVQEMQNKRQFFKLDDFNEGI
jgi:predicted kinase